MRRRRPPLTPADELTLLLVRVSAVRHLEAGRIRALAAEAAPSEVIESFARQQLLPLFGRRLADAGAAPEVVAASRGALEHAERLDDMRELALAQVLQALQEAGIRAAALKGPRFGSLVYGDLGFRASRDLDLLVDVEGLRDAVGIVQRLGWSAPADVTAADGLPLLHFALPHPHGLPPIELHWRVHWYERRFAQEALARGTVRGDSVELRADDQLAFCLLFAIRDGFSGLRLTVDAISFLEQHAEWADGVAGIQRAHPRLGKALGLAADHIDRFSGLPVPHLRPYRESRARLAARLADPLLRLDPKQAVAERGLLDVLGAPRRGTPAAFKRQLLPPVDELRHRAGIDAEGAPRARSRAGHALRTIRRYLAAPLVRARRPTSPGG